MAKRIKKPPMAALQRKLMGVPDARGPVGILSRGANVYRGTSLHAHSGGGPQYGRPRKAAAMRRFGRRR
jgi:hypothetical protein